MRTKHLVKTFIYLAFVLAGLLLVFRYNWSRDLSRWLALAGLILAVLCGIAFCASLVRVFFPHFHPAHVTGRFAYLRYKQQHKYAAQSSWLFLFLVISLMIALVWLYAGGTGIVERYHFDRYGRTQKVVIREIRTIGRTPYALFDLPVGGDTTSGQLPQQEGLRAGDTATVIYSILNPDIIDWAGNR